MNTPVEIPTCIQEWCDRNDYTDLQQVDKAWWAIAPHAAMPTPLPAFAELQQPFLRFGTPYTVAFDLTYGVMTYQMNGTLILGVEWEWGDRATPVMREINLNPDAGYMAYDEPNQSVWFQIRADRIFWPLPDGWVLTTCDGVGLTVTATAQKVTFTPQLEAA